MSQGRLFREPAPVVGQDVDLDLARRCIAAAPDGARYGIDLETTSGNPKEKALRPEVHNIAGVGVWCPWWETGFYFPLRHKHGPNLDETLVREMLAPLIDDPTKPWNAHNAKFEHRFMTRRWGRPPAGKPRCTYVAAHLVDENGRKALEDVAPRYLGMDKLSDEVQRYLKAEGSEDYGDLPVDIAGRYCVQDAKLSYKLDDNLTPQMRSQELMPLYELEMETLPCVSAQEARGHALDLDRLLQLERDVRAQRDQLAAAACAIIGRDLKLTSPTLLVDVLYNVLGLPVSRRTKDGQPAIDEHALAGLDHDFPRAVLAWRPVQKLHSTYLEPAVELHVDGVLHGEMDQCGAASGRFSHYNPNTANIPKDPVYRSCWKARPGWSLLYADYSQFQFRVFAHYSNDPRIIKAYQTNPKADFHDLVRQELTEQLHRPIERDPAKTLNLALLFGMGAELLALQLSAVMKRKVTVEEARAFKASYFRIFPTVKKIQDQCAQRMEQRGYITGLSKRRRRECPAHIAFNAIHQSGEADMVREAMVKTAPVLRRFGGHHLLVIHDELVMEIPTVVEEEVKEAARPLLEAMLSVNKLRVPLMAKMEWSTTTWAERKALPL